MRKGSHQEGNYKKTTITLTLNSALEEELCKAYAETSLNPDQNKVLDWSAIE